jgi:hypothetical protein
MTGRRVPLTCAKSVALLALIVVGANRGINAQHASGSIVGLFVNPDYSIVPGEVVEARAFDDGPVVARTVVDFARTFRLTGIAPGTYTVRVGQQHQRVVAISRAETAAILISEQDKCSPSGTDAPRLSDRDVADMIRLSLRMSGVRYRVTPPVIGPDEYHGEGIAWFRHGRKWPRQRETPLVVDGLRRQWLSRLDDLPVIPMSSDEAQERANLLGDMYYLRVKDVRPSADCAAVTVYRSMLLNERLMGTRTVLCCESSRFQFRRRDGRWEFDLVGTTVM